MPYFSKRCNRKVKIDKKLFLITSDGEAREISMVELLKLEHNYCLDHLINLCCEKSHFYVKTLFDKHNRIITLFSRSSVGREYLKTEQIADNKQPLSLKKGCLTGQWLGKLFIIRKNSFIKTICNWIL